MSAQFKNILFDLDGTLVDPKDGVIKSLQYALKKGGLPVPEMEELYWVIGPPTHTWFSTLAPQLSEAEVWKFVDYYRERYESIGKLENVMYPGIPELLAQVSRTHKVFTATSKPTHFAKPILEHYDLAKYFLKIYGSELNGVRSDKAELISYILREENLNPRETVIVGDRKFDAIGAKKTGISSVCVTWGYGPRSELEEAGADHILTKAAEVADFFQKN